MNLRNSYCELLNLHNDENGNSYLHHLWRTYCFAHVHDHSQSMRKPFLSSKQKTCLCKSVLQYPGVSFAKASYHKDVPTTCTEHNSKFLNRRNVQTKIPRTYWSNKHQYGELKIYCRWPVMKLWAFFLFLPLPTKERAGGFYWFCVTFISLHHKYM